MRGEGEGCLSKQHDHRSREISDLFFKVLNLRPQSPLSVTAFFFFIPKIPFLYLSVLALFLPDFTSVTAFAL